LTAATRPRRRDSSTTRGRHAHARAIAIARSHTLAQFYWTTLEREPRNVFAANGVAMVLAHKQYFAEVDN
jgi:hypothetical protein